MEVLLVVVEHMGALLEGDAHRAVAAVIGVVAGGLVGKQVDVDVLCQAVLQQIYDVAVVGDGDRLFLLHVLLGPLEYLIQVVADQADPALIVTGLDAAFVHFGEHTHGPGDFRRLGLSAAHAAQAGGDKELTGQVAFGRNAQEFPSGVEDGVEGAVDDALGPDVHPAAGGHLAVVGHAHFFGNLPIVDVVEHTHHQSVGEDNTGSVLLGGEQAHRMARFDDQGLIRRYWSQFWQTLPVSP